MKRLFVLVLCWLACSAWGETEVPLNKVNVATDLPTVARGAETVMTVCVGCHSLKYIRFRELVKLGVDKDKVDGWRGANPMGATIASQLPAEAAVTSFGKAPPDLSLIAKAREGEANYIYSYLLGYYTTPEGATGNHYFPTTKMPDVLAVAGVTDPAQHAQLEQKAREVTSFLVWAADPHAQERKSLGFYVLAYLFVFTTLLYFLKNRIWAQLDKP
ncbi:MAG: cytochrome c1 [Nitrosomonadales bacterium]